MSIKADVEHIRKEAKRISDITAAGEVDGGPSLASLQGAIYDCLDGVWESLLLIAGRVDTLAESDS